MKEKKKVVSTKCSRCGAENARKQTNSAYGVVRLCDACMRAVWPGGTPDYYRDHVDVKIEAQLEQDGLGRKVREALAPKPSRRR